MADDPPQTPANRDSIALFQRAEIRYWCVTLGCNEPQLREAVMMVGNSATRVREYLAQRSDS